MSCDILDRPSLPGKGECSAVAQALLLAAPSTFIFREGFMREKSCRFSSLPLKIATLLAFAVFAPLAGSAQAPPCNTAVPTVTLSQPSGAQLCGFQDTAQDNGSPLSAAAYIGIRYAQAPVRWQNPQALTTPWTGTFSATQYGNICYQSKPGPPPPTSCTGTNCPNPLPACTQAKPTQSEDCLYLNVWVPNNTAPNAGLPVMVYIHGGAFLEGSGSTPLFDGVYLAAKHNVIVVSFNYRLGVLGFLAMDGITDATNNNFGFRDQIMALQWVQKNIGSFGGDKDNVTLFGESAGAMSVGLHALSSPTSKGKFKNALMESNPLGVPYKDMKTAVQVGNHFASKTLNGCNAACMKSKSATDLVNAETSASFTKWAANPTFLGGAGLKLEALLLWSPTLDGTLLKGQPVNSGASLTAPMVLGTNQDEGTLFAVLAASAFTPFDQSAYSNLLLALFGWGNDVGTKYPCSASDCTATLAKVFTDFLFTCSNRRLAISAANTNNVYMYYFNQVPGFSCYWLAACVCAGQVCHGDELPFVFHTPAAVCPGPGYSFTADEEALSTRMAGDWAGFAAGTAPWQPFGSTKLYEFLNSTGGSATDPFAASANCTFWEKHYSAAMQEKMLRRLSKGIRSQKK